MLTADAQRSQGITKLEYWLNELVFWGLIIQALWATLQSLSIIFVQLPASEEKLLTDTIAQADINLLVNDAILSVFSSVLGVALAAWFARSRTQGTKFWETALGVVALVVNFALWRLLANQNSLTIIESLIDLLP